MLLALVVLFVLDPSITNLIVVLAITRIPVYLRTARAQTLEVRERVFIEVARAAGASHWRIMTRDIAPMVFPTIRTLAMLEVATVILQAASLTFLGIGLQRPDVDWGMMVADGREYLRIAWFVTVFPGLVIVFTALAASLFSNWLRAVEDPAQNAHFFARSRRRKAAPVMSALLQVENVRIDFNTQRGVVHALRGVSFSVDQGELLAMVGASGSGKTVLSRSLLGLVDEPGVVNGSIVFDGQQVVGAPESRLRAIRGLGMAMVFQDALDGLNPVYTIGSQLMEILTVRMKMSRAEARREALRLMAGGRHPECGVPVPRLSAPVLGRDAAAHLHRAGRRPAPENPHRRRADHGAGCHRPGRASCG